MVALPQADHRRLVADIGPLLARVGKGFFQQAWVVVDLDAARTAMCGALGAGEFVEFATGDLDYDVRGRTVSCALRLGFARAGNVQIELIEPVSGDGIHVEFLARCGSGPHHLGFLVDDLDAQVAAATADGFGPVMSGRFGSVRLCYVDTFAALGVYVELIEDPDDAIRAVMPWRD